MPNLDELSHDMTFTVGGETFVVHDVPPEILMAMENADEEESEKDPSEQKTPLERVDEQILMFLNGDQDQVNRYRALRERKEDPVPLWKLLAFRTALWETQSDRPTNPPSPSAAGRGKTVRSSEGA